MAIDLMRCFLMRLTVRPGHVVKWPFLIAWMKVEVTSANAHLCKYAARSLFVLFW